LRIALDTNRYVDLAAGSSEAVLLLEHAEEIALPFVVVAELRAGFAMGTKGAENERVLQRFLRKPHVRVLYPSDTTTRTYATLYRQLRQRGSPIPTNDLWIASLVVEHGLVLYSRDAQFRKLPQLELL
jgi:tRNA(fMet)-specific endonuclease VapC